MMDEAMMKSLKGKMMPVEGKDKEHKMEVLKELIQQMNMLMADSGDGMDAPPMDGMPHMDGAKVEVQAENPHQLEKGLDMAKNVVSQSHEMPMQDDEDEMEEDYA